MVEQRFQIPKGSQIQFSPQFKPIKLSQGEIGRRLKAITLESYSRDIPTTSQKITLPDNLRLPERIESYDPRSRTYISQSPTGAGTTAYTRMPTPDESQRIREAQLKGSVFDKPTSEIIEQSGAERINIKKFEDLTRDISELKGEELDKRLNEIKNIGGAKVVGTPTAEGTEFSISYEPTNIKVSLPFFKDKTLFEIPTSAITAKSEGSLYLQTVSEGVGKVGTGISVAGGKVLSGFTGGIFDIVGKVDVVSPRYYGSKVGEIVKKPSILFDKFKYRGTGSMVLDLDSNVARLPTEEDSKRQDLRQTLHSDFLVTKEGAQTGAKFLGETGVSYGKYLVPIAGGVFFASDVERQVRPYDYNPISFVKEEPLQAAMLGGILLGAVAMKGYKMSRPKKLTPLQESNIMLQKIETESARLLKERQKLLGGLKYVEDPTKGIVKRQPFEYVGLGKKTLTGQEAIVFAEKSTGIIIKPTREVPKKVIDIGLYTQPQEVYRVTQDLFPKLKYSSYIEKPVKQTSYLLTGTTKVGKDMSGVGVSYQIGAKGIPISKQVISISGKQTGQSFETLFKTFEAGRKSKKIVQAGEMPFIIESFPTGRLVKQEFTGTKILSTQKEGDVLFRRYLTQRKEIPTTPTRLFGDEFSKVLMEKPKKEVFGFRRTKEITEDVVIPSKLEPSIKIEFVSGKDSTSAVIVAKIDEPFVHIAKGKEIPEGFKWISQLEEQRILTTTGKKSSGEFLQGLYQQQKLQVKDVILVPPKPKVSTVRAEIIKPLELNIGTVKADTIWAGAGLYERTTEIGTMGVLTKEVSPISLASVTRSSTMDLGQRDMLGNNILLKDIQREKIREDIKLDTRTDTRLMVGTRLKLFEAIRLGQRELIKLSQRERMKELIKEKTKQKQAQRMDVFEVLKTGIRTKTSEIIDTKIKPPTTKTSDIKLPKTSSSDKDKIDKLFDEEFKVFVKKGGEDISIGEFKTFIEAKKKLRGELSETLRASGFIESKGKKVKIDLGDFGSEFRMAKKDQFRIVQKASKRLSRKGETKEIQFFKKKGGFF